MNKNDLDKIAAKALKPLTAEQVVDSISLISEKYLEKFDSCEYLMLLSKELSYYTIFKVEKSKSNWMTAARIIRLIETDDFLSGEVGAIKHVEISDYGFVEIWVGETHFALFEASNFIVKI